MLPTLKANHKALLKPAVDILLTVTMDSVFLSGIVDHLNTDDWFAWLSEAFRPANTGLSGASNGQDIKIKEKLSVIFQKLSKFRCV